MNRKEFLQNGIIMSGGLIAGTGALSWAGTTKSNGSVFKALNANQLSMLHINGAQILNASNEEVFLRGTNIGGWMLMEDFINGFPGMEHSLRMRMAKAMGPEKAEFFSIPILIISLLKPMPNTWPKSVVR